MTPDLRKKENLHIVFWLIKDFCWISDFKTAGMVMVAPTLILAIYLTIRSRKNQADLFHNIAVTFWISANSIWMTGEFFFDDHWRPYAIPFFIAGIVSILFYYLKTAISKKS